MSAPARDRDYVLGTHDEEIERLGLQHRVWRSTALEAWRRAGIADGQTILDVGSGPGYAAADLAELVGPRGRVVALERSQRFLAALRAMREQRGLPQIEPHEVDLDRDPIPARDADGAWDRWVFSFVTDPRRLLERVHAALRPGGTLVTHEYVDYATWKMCPRSEEHEEFVRAVMDSWRADGGEPDIALPLARWMRETGFAIRSMRPHVFVITPASDIWQWPKAFIASGPRRLVELGRMHEDTAAAIARAFARTEATPNAYMVTPAVLEIVAERV